MKYLLRIYKSFNQNIRVVFIASLFFSSSFFQSIRAETQETARELPSMTVFAIRGAGDEVVHRSEIEWDLTNDSTITMERDGSYTAGDTTNPYSLKALLVSLGNPKVNVNISYAKNSVSMTADGRAILATLVDALDYLDEGTTIHLTPINRPAQINKSVTQRRIDFLREVLQQVKGINLKIMPSKTLKTASSKSKQLHYWRIQIQRKV